MVRHWSRAILFSLLAAPALPQSVPQTNATSGSAGQAIITPKNGQSNDQLWFDRYECYTWAKSQSGFDPSVGRFQGNSSGADAYRRAFAACLDGRGYGVVWSVPPPSESAPAPTQPPPSVVHTVPSAASSSISYVYAPGPELKYEPIAVQIEGGYTVAAGTTGSYLNDGPNVGVGLTWYPTSALPVGVRVDGSYSWFDAGHELLDSGGYTNGHENIYGGDADLQLDLAHRSSRNKLYLIGGGGYYHEQVHLRQVSLESGLFCGYFGCGTGLGPVVTAEERETSAWRRSWNAGLGWETAVADHASFFLEARYWRIAPLASKTQFVPIRAGLRF